MSLFITDSLDINLEDRLNNIISTNRKEDDIYRYTKYTSNLSEINNIFNRLLKEMIVILLSDIDTFSCLTTKLELLNKKIYILSYHFSDKNITELVNIFFHDNVSIDITYIYKLLLDELLNNYNMTAFKYLNYLFNNIYSKEKQKEYFNEYIYHELYEFMQRINNYNEIGCLLEKIYYETEDLFSNLLFNCLGIKIQDNIVNKFSSIYYYLYDNNIWKWLVIKTNINEKICSKFINSERLYDCMYNNKLKDEFILLDHIKDIYNFLRFKENSNIIIKHFLEKDDIIIPFIKLSDKQLELEKNIIKELSSNNNIKELVQNVDRLLLNHDYDNIEPLIFLCSLSFKNNDNELFKKLYTKYLKERLLSSKNSLNFENIAIKILDVYIDDDIFIKKLKKYIYDIEFNKELNEEFKQQLIMKGNYLNSSEYENMKITTYSPNIWDNIFNKGVIININKDILILNTLGKYINYYQKYYEYKFKNRKLNCYGNIGNIKFNLIEDNKVVEINCNPVQFIIIDCLINYQSFIIYTAMKNYLNIFSKDLDKELEILVKNNIIYLKNNNYYLTDIKDMNLTYDLIQQVDTNKNDKDIINKNNNNIIKSAIVFELKREKIINKEELYGDIKYNLAKRLCLKYQQFDSIVNNLIDLEYCKLIDNNLEYIP